jgi:hypothetical protein
LSYSRRIVTSWDRDYKVSFDVYFPSLLHLFLTSIV